MVEPDDDGSQVCNEKSDRDKGTRATSGNLDYLSRADAVENTSRYMNNTGDETNFENSSELLGYINVFVSIDFDLFEICHWQN